MDKFTSADVRAAIADMPVQSPADLERERMLTAYAADLAERESAEPVEWQFYEDGVWHIGIKSRNGKPLKNIVPAGTPTRDLFTHPAPRQSESAQSITEQQIKDSLRATGYLTHSQAWECAESVMKLLAAAPAPAAQQDDKRELTTADFCEWADALFSPIDGKLKASERRYSMSECEIAKLGWDAAIAAQKGGGK